MNMLLWQVIGQDARLLSAAQEQKKRSESSLAQKERQITKLDTAFNKASQEVLKVRLVGHMGVG